MGSNTRRKAHRTVAGHEVIIKDGVLSARTICGLDTPKPDTDALPCQSCRLSIRHNVRTEWVRPEGLRTDRTMKASTKSQGGGVR